MTVRELRKLLEKEDQDALVVHEGSPFIVPIQPDFEVGLYDDENLAFVANGDENERVELDQAVKALRI